MRKGLLSFLLFVVVGLSAVQAAYDFSVVVPSGQTLYFDIISSSSSTVRASYPGSSSYPYSGYTKPTGNLVIPDTVTYQGISYSVTSIGNYAFSGCSGLTLVTIGNSVTSIGDYAFNGCSGLTTLNFNAINCGDFSNGSYHPFYNCPIATINIGDSVQRIPAFFAYNLESLTSVTIPNSVTSIEYGTFSGCSGLTSVTIPNSITTIGSYAFSGCSGLTSVTIPNSVTSIGDYAFRYCSGLTTLNFNAINCGDFSSSYHPFYNCPIDIINIGDSVQRIPVYFAYNLDSLTSITIPNSVTSIGSSAFRGCSGLTLVTIGNSVTSIGDYAFDGCSGLTTLNFNAINCGDFSSGSYHPFYNCPIATINIGDSVQQIPAYFAYNLESLTSVTIPNSVTSIGRYAFYDCSGLTSVTIPNSVTSIGERAFRGCSGLTSVTIGNSVTSIGNYAFRGCSGLTSVTIPNSVTAIGYYAFSDCSGLTSVTIPNSVTSIESYAFDGCSGLTTLNFNAINCGDFSSSYRHPFYNSPIATINIGDSVQRIPASFADSLESLTSVTIPNSVTSIGERAFRGCSGLTSVTIGNSVTSIGDRAFYDCSGLTSVTIGNSVTSIGSSAFRGCTGLTSVTIPNSVTSIGYGAFEYCSGLTSVTIPNSVTSIGNYAFSDCSGLTTLNFNAINCGDFSSSFYHPFYNCPITTINIGDSVQHIPAYFAYNLDSLLSVIIPNRVTSIGNYAFRGCTGLTSITIPNSVTTIGKSAFTDCGHLASATISSGVNRIEESTFENCTSLVTITIPSNVANIEDKAFNGCSSLHEVISLAVLPPSLGEEIFSATAILKVPCGSADYYNSAASRWTQYFVGIEEICNVTITVTSANESMGTVSGGGEYEFGTEVTITATPNQGYRFASWNDGNTDNPRTITVTEDATYIASFEESVGIESRDMLSELAFYPNPTSGIITFNRNDIMKVEVLDAMGKMVAVYENAYTIDISKLAKGYYAMRITTPEGVAVRKVIRK